MRNAFALVFILPILALSGCSDDKTSEPDSAYPNLSTSQVEEIYTSKLRTDAPAEFSTLDDETLLRVGKVMCEFFEAGATFDEMAMMTMDAGYSADVTAMYIAYTTTALCPELGVLDD